MSGKYISLGQVLFRIMKNPLLSELTYDDAAEYTLEYIRILGAPLTYLDKIERVELTNYKAELPCDLIEIRGIRYSGCYFNDGGIPLRYASDNYHLDDNNFSDNTYYRDNYQEYTYTTQKGIIFASKANGHLDISYKAVACDDDGYPLIPDDEKVVRGLEYYILYKYLEPFWMMGKITDKVFDYITQQYDWYVGAADASLRSINPDKAETLFNSINRIIRSNTSHMHSFKNLGRKEFLRRYN